MAGEAMEAAALALYNEVTTIIQAKVSSGEIPPEGDAAVGVANNYITAFSTACKEAGSDDFPEKFRDQLIAQPLDQGEKMDENSGVEAAALAMYKEIGALVTAGIESGNIAADEGVILEFCNKYVDSFATACSEAGADDFPEKFRAQLEAA